MPTRHLPGRISVSAEPGKSDRPQLHGMVAALNSRFHADGGRDTRQGVKAGAVGEVIGAAASADRLAEFRHKCEAGMLAHTVAQGAELAIDGAGCAPGRHEPFWVDE